MTKRLSLSSELRLIQTTLRGIKMLAEKLDESPQVGVEERALANSIGATLAIVTQRLGILEKVVRGSINPSAILCSENCAVPDPEPGEIVLSEWDEPNQPSKQQKRQRTR